MHICRHIRKSVKLMGICYIICNNKIILDIFKFILYLLYLMEIITNSTYEVQASLSFEFYRSKHRVIASSAIYMMRYKEDNKIDVHST
jgi:hypothetical protein